jgi:aarF domain-containing kinase
MNRLLPNEFIRMGSTLITTSSICIDYRLQEVIEGDLNICHKRASIKIGNLCASNGGLYIKAAQYLSSMDHLLPKCYIEELSKLHDQAPASSMEDIEQVFKEEFGGKELNELFYDICHVPIGSASVGQVHLAKLRSTGEEVALKIQHPNIKKDSEIDLKSFKLVLKIVKQFYPTLNFDWIVDEFRSCLESELNFKIEAENSKKTKIAFENDSKFRRMVLIPKVYDNLTSERVLTMEFITGFKINDIEGMKSAGLDLKMINHLMYEVFMEMIFKHNFLHCDPHPGNILINTPVNGGDIRIVILDHGIYKIIPSNIVTKFSRLFLAILEKDFKTISELSKDFDISVEILEEIVSLLKKDFKSLDTDDLREEIGNFIMKQSESNKIQASEALKTIPREFYFIIKVIDVLRSNERCLTCETKTRKIPSSLFILANYCLNHQDPKSISNLIVNYFKLLKWFIFRNRT